MELGILTIVIIMLVTMAIAIGSLIFVVWVMFTIAKSLKEISSQTARISALMAAQNAKLNEQK